MRHHQIPSALALLGPLSLLVVASPAGFNAATSNTLMPRKRKDPAFITICSSFNFQHCETIKEGDIKDYSVCVKVAKDSIDLDGGDSSIQLNKAACQFFATEDCNLDPKEIVKYGAGGYVELPIKQELPPSFGKSVFKTGQTSICSL